MKRLETFGTCKDGVLHIIRREAFWLSFKVKFKDGEQLKIIIEKLYSKRSNPQNNYYWGVVNPVLLFEVNEQGNEMTRDSLHEELLKKFAPKREIKNKSGEFIEIPMRTHEMNKSQMGDFTSDVMRWGAEFWGVNIPEPGEQTEIFNKD
jgi:hypothetical protein